jgi:hypothetical protein
MVKTRNNRRNRRSAKSKKGMTKNYRCKEDNCQRTFSREDALINHLKSRHGKWSF